MVEDPVGEIDFDVLLVQLRQLRRHLERIVAARRGRSPAWRPRIPPARRVRGRMRGSLSGNRNGFKVKSSNNRSTSRRRVSKGRQACIAALAGVAGFSSVVTGTFVSAFAMGFLHRWLFASLQSLGSNMETRDRIDPTGSIIPSSRRICDASRFRGRLDTPAALRPPHREVQVWAESAPAGGRLRKDRNPRHSPDT